MAAERDNLGDALLGQKLVGLAHAALEHVKRHVPSYALAIRHGVNAHKPVLDGNIFHSVNAASCHTSPSTAPAEKVPERSSVSVVRVAPHTALSKISSHKCSKRNSSIVLIARKPSAMFTCGQSIYSLGNRAGGLS